MRLDELVAWYQKKIGTYDKQQWEKTIEQKILAGITHLQLKNTKLKTELIDVDLVRGSTFPKAKSKLSILTVIYLAALRLLFLPIYAKWWVQQTSPRVFVLLLTLYLLQMINLGIYSYNVNKNGAEEEEHIVSVSEFLIPMALSLLLSVIHSQIVATASNNNIMCRKLKKCQSYSNLKKRERIRRKRRTRTTTTTSQDCGDNSQDDEAKPETPQPGKTKAKNNLYNVASKSPSGSPARTARKQGACSTSSSTSSDALNNQAVKASLNQEARTTLHKEITEHPNKEQILSADGTNYSKNSANLTVSSNRIIEMKTLAATVPFLVNDTPDEIPFPNEPGCSLRRRNVNWDPRMANRNSNDRQVEEAPIAPDAPIDDDGFESLNGKSSGGEDSSNAGIPAEAFYRKVPYSNVWNRSDSDTDTLRQTPTLQEQLNSQPLLTSTQQSTKPRKHLSSESGIELQHRNDSANKATLDSDRTHHSSVLDPIDVTGGPTRSTGSGFDEKLESSGDTDEENDFDLHLHPDHHDHNHHSHHHFHHHHHLHHHQSEGEECTYSSDLNHSDGQNEHSDDDYDLEDAPTIILNPPCGASDRVSCTIWDAREAKKADMSVLDISSAIIERVEAMPETCDYVYIGLALSLILSLIPAFCRLCEATVDPSGSNELNILNMPVLLLEKASFSCMAILRFAFGESTWEKTVLLLGFILRLCLTYLIFFLLAVAERTFKQRFLYAKLFSHLTSSRRAQKSAIPHFRLNKVRNIKTWLCVRSYLKRRGPQNSVDVIVSAAFIITLLLLAFLSVEWLKDSVHLHSQFNLEALMWSCAFGTFLLRFMTLGTKINKKYKSVSVLITEQINLYVQIEQKPNKKEELMISNNVLKLAADLLKELESPFKISGLSANPYLYTTVKVVILSALSGVLSEMLGFKLKLHKIKIK
ncbi:protein phtf isoform X2 [Uranotaenia lowii]|uniref:protein phtf isoform X2 n=1 Tax=Uranotaenia lowii TaxID=190385 RepID=UPI0024786AC6|nr:protein phtf isoform X2 [Uranotaenia lowii]